MKRIFKFILLLIIICPLFVSAKEYTRDDLHDALETLARTDLTPYGLRNLRSLDGFKENSFYFYLIEEDGTSQIHYNYFYDIDDNQLIFYQDAYVYLNYDSVNDSWERTFYYSHPSYDDDYFKYVYITVSIMNGNDIEEALDYYEKQGMVSLTNDNQLSDIYSDQNVFDCFNDLRDDPRKRNGYVHRPISLPNNFNNLNKTDRNKTFYIEYFQGEDICSNYFDYTEYPDGTLGAMYEIKYYFRINSNIKIDESVDDENNDNTDNEETNTNDKPKVDVSNPETGITGMMEFSLLLLLGALMIGVYFYYQKGRGLNEENN